MYLSIYLKWRLSVPHLLIKMVGSFVPIRLFGMLRLLYLYIYLYYLGQCVFLNVSKTEPNVWSKVPDCLSYVLPTWFNLSFVRQHSLMWNISQGCTTGMPAPTHAPPSVTSVETASLASLPTACPAKVRVSRTHTHTSLFYLSYHLSFSTICPSLLPRLSIYSLMDQQEACHCFVCPSWAVVVSISPGQVEGSGDIGLGLYNGEYDLLTFSSSLPVEYKFATSPHHPENRSISS